MTAAAEELFKTVLALPTDERKALAEAIEASLRPEENDLSPEWKREIARRIEAIESGKTKLLSGDEVEARIQKALAGVEANAV